MQHEQLAVIVGPTAVGKTAVAVEVARQLNGEIISGDSMQVYRDMDIGTAKIKPEEMQDIPHYLINIRHPNQEFSVADFQDLVKPLITDINLRGKLPILVGGTGLYIRSIIDQYEFMPAPPEPIIRQQLRERAEKQGIMTLYNYLQQIDPKAAQKIHPHDLRRIVRAIEVYESSGQPISSSQNPESYESPYQLALVGLTMERQQLYQRINDRVDHMVAEGLIDEVKRLLKKGFTAENKALQGLGYKEAIGYIQGQYNLDVATELIKRNTRRFAKRQLTWWRRDHRVLWFEVEKYVSLSNLADEIAEIICRTIKTSVE